MATKRDPPTLNIEIVKPDITHTKTDDLDWNSSAKFTVNYLGNSVVDRRYTAAIIQWVVREISQQNRPKPADLLVKSHGLIITEKQDELSSPHNHDFDDILKILRLKNHAKLLAFVTVGKTESEPCCCHVFCCETEEAKVTVLHELKSRIVACQSEAAKEISPPRKLTAPAAVKMSHRRNLSYGGSVPQAQEDPIHRFSVFYVGKVTISEAKAPPKFVDEMLRRIKLLEVDSQRQKKNGSHEKSPAKVTGNSKHASSGKIIDFDQQSNNGDNTKRLRSASDGDKRIPTGVPLNGKENHIPAADDGHHSQKVVDLNDDISLRVVTFQVSMSSLMLFSAGNKQLLLEKKIREISYCTKGHQRSDHFGFICREKKNHILYLFQGESEHVVDQIMKAMKQAFTDALQASAHLSLCDNCPVQILNKLCSKIEESPLSEQQAAVQEHLQCLSETEYMYLMNKFNANKPDTDAEKITLLVSLLRTVYDRRQKVHQHNIPGMGVNVSGHPHPLDEIRDRSRSTFFEKAKKSFTSSFDNLITRRQRAKTCLSVDQPLSVDTTVSNNKGSGDAKRCLSPNLPRSSSEDSVLERQRSRTFNSCPPTPDFQSTCQTRFVIPESDGECKVEANISNEGEGIEKEDKKQGPAGCSHKKVARQGSWRQHIYNTVTVDVSINEEKKKEETDSGALARARWRKAIMEQRILIRMEKENRNLADKISATETRRQKLSYEVFESCTAEAATTWDELLAKNWKEKFDDNVLLAAVKAGVPKYRRGEVWKFLVQQHSIRAPKKEGDERLSKNYDELLEEPTSHQHAILIDIGRTFPSHMYFNAQLGAGQIGLFNLLKSYSLLDDEVGYCQGLSFVAGLLLMHMSEQDAFESFRYIMHNLGIRHQYKPDMTAVQQQLYQLSRLLHDFQPNIYEHFNTHDVTPTLYAAPWFLTLFASHYPTGFVVRIMDLIFLQGLEVIFKIALVLFANSSADILECDGFESIIEFMKEGLPETVKTQGQELIGKALDMDIKYQLNLFEVEYQLLHEEMIDIRQNRERYEKLEAANRELTQQVNDQKCELDYAKESAEALRKELIETREYQARNIEALNAENAELKSRLGDLETQLRLLKFGGGATNGISHDITQSSVVSPASSEVSDIMRRTLEKKDSTDGRGSMEKSWELVPSPTTVNQEMIDFDSNSAPLSQKNLNSLNGDKDKPPVLVNCKSASNDSYESMDLINFDSSAPCGIMSAACSNVLSSSDESLLDDSPSQKDDAKVPMKKKRPALPLIHTTGLLATYKNPEAP